MHEKVKKMEKNKPRERWCWSIGCQGGDEVKGGKMVISRKNVIKKKKLSPPHPLFLL